MNNSLSEENNVDKLQACCNGLGNGNAVVHIPCNHITVSTHAFVQDMFKKIQPKDSSE
jgi:hypothetical protein